MHTIGKGFKIRIERTNNNSRMIRLFTVQFDKMFTVEGEQDAVFFRRKS